MALIYRVRIHRRMINEHFRPSVVSKFRAIQTRQVRILQKRLLDAPEDFLYHMRQYVCCFSARDKVIYLASFH